MVIGILFLMFVAMGLIALFGSALLFLVRKEKTNDIILILMTAYSLIISYLSAGAQPVNYVSEQIVCWLIGFVAVIGAGIRFGTGKQSVFSKILVIVSVLAGVAKLFLL